MCRPKLVQIIVISSIRNIIERITKPAFVFDVTLAGESSNSKIDYEPLKRAMNAEISAKLTFPS